VSQIIKPLTSSGPIPPIIPTSFVLDDGTAIPAANVLDVFGIDSTENNANGILTRATPNLGNVLDIVITNRIQGTASTAGAVTTAISTFTPTAIGTYAIECRVAAFNTTASLGAGYSIFGTARFDGANSTLCGTMDRIVNEEGTMSSANVTMTVSGANILINGVGYAANNINWSAVGLYTFVGP
jgi:hypothetical protein